MPSLWERLLGDKSPENQDKVHSGEIFQLWQHLTMRYDIRELTDVFQNFASDIEFKALLTYGMNMLDEEINIIEKKMDHFGIPLPPRPPKSISSPTNTEVLRDHLMFRIIYMGIQNFLTQQTNSILAMQNHDLRDMFIKMKEKELNAFIKMTEYGKIKGWLHVPPGYNPGTLS